MLKSSKKQEILENIGKLMIILAITGTKWVNKIENITHGLL